MYEKMVAAGQPPNTTTYNALISGEEASGIEWCSHASSSYAFKLPQYCERERNHVLSRLLGSGSVATHTLAALLLLPNGQPLLSWVLVSCLCVLVPMRLFLLLRPMRSPQQGGGLAESAADV